MPANEDFAVKIHVGGRAIPEYRHDGRYLVECNLDTEVSYKQAQAEVINGEKEIQNWPVTPYEIELNAHTSLSSPHYFRVLVDGVKVKGISLEPGTTQLIKGFRDGGCIREFLFSMPRFAQDLNDRLPTERTSAVGKIEVQCWKAVLRKTKRGRRRKNLEFEQANKKDATAVTQGQYTMATSKAGRVVCSRSIYRCVDNWKLIGLQSKIHVEYHMAHTLRDMGIILRPITCDPVYVLNSRRLPTADGAGASSGQARPVNPQVELIDLTVEDSDDGDGVPEVKRHKSEEIEIKQEPDLVRSTRRDSVSDGNNENTAPITIPSQSQTSAIVDDEMPEAGNSSDINSPKEGTSSSAKENGQEDETGTHKDVNVDKEVSGEAADITAVDEGDPDTNKSTESKNPSGNEKATSDSGEIVSMDESDTNNKTVNETFHRDSDVASPDKNGEKNVAESGADDVTNEGVDTKVMEKERFKGDDSTQKTSDKGAGDEVSNEESAGDGDDKNPEMGAGDATTGANKVNSSSDELLAELDSLISKTDPKNSSRNNVAQNNGIDDVAEIDTNKSVEKVSRSESSHDVTSSKSEFVSEKENMEEDIAGQKQVDSSGGTAGDLPSHDNKDSTNGIETENQAASEEKH